MKRFLAIIMLFFALTASAQNIYHSETVVEVDGVKYDVKHTQHTFSVSNQANRLSSEANWRYLDGTTLKTEAEYNLCDAETKVATVYRALRETFGDNVIKALRVRAFSPMYICYVVSPEGETLEVSFIMDRIEPFLSIPISSFATLENKLKEYVVWEPNEYARKLQFIQVIGFVNFDMVPLSSELITVKKDVELETGLEPLD